MFGNEAQGSRQPVFQVLGRIFRPTEEGEGDMRGTCQQGNINGTVRVVAVEVQVNADRAAGVAQDKFMSGQTLAVSAVTGQRQIGGVAFGSIDQDVLDVVNIQQFTGFCVLAVIEDETAQGIFFVAVIHDFNFLDTIKDFGQKIVQQGMQDAKSVGGRLAGGWDDRPRCQALHSGL